MENTLTLEHEGIMFFLAKHSPEKHCKDHYLSRCGQVVSLATNKPKTRKQSKSGKYAVITCKNSDGKNQTFLVHRLMAFTFLETPEDYHLYQVDHIHDYRPNLYCDGTKRNHVDNLQWLERVEHQSKTHKTVELQGHYDSRAGWYRRLRRFLDPSLRNCQYLKHCTNRRSPYYELYRQFCNYITYAPFPCKGFEEFCIKVAKIDPDLFYASLKDTKEKP